MTDYEIQGPTRVCAATGRELKPGDRFCGVLTEEGGKLVRRDYAADAWTGPPPGHVAYWTGKVPPNDRPRKPVVNDDLLLDCFNRLKESGESTFNRLSEQLLETPMFMSAFRRAVEAKGSVDRTVSGAMDFMNLPSKNDFERVLEEVNTIGAQLTRQQKTLAGIEQALAQIQTRLAQLAPASVQQGAREP